MRSQWAIGALLVAGFLLRTVALERIPPGLWSDEANHGLEARQILETGEAPIFFPGNCGQEPLFKYLVAIFTALFGSSVATLRLVSGIAGWSLLPLTWKWMRLRFDRQTAIWTLIFLTFGVWHIHFSRIAFRAILGPPLCMAAIWAIDKIHKETGMFRFYGAGILCGLLWYTYPAFRLFSLICFIWLIALTWRHEYKWRVRAAYLMGFIFILIPLAWAWKDNPELFTARASMAALWTESSNVISGILRNTIRHLGMFHVAGDQNWRHNLSGVPHLDILTGFFFLVGLAVSLGRRTKNDVVLLVWLIIMLVPGILSVERQAPHCLRTLGVLPVPYILAAQGIVWIGKRYNRWKGWLIPAAIVAVIGVSNMARYFVAWPRELQTLSYARESLYGFHRQEYSLGSWLQRHVPRHTIWLSPQLYLHPTVAYSAPRLDYRLIADPHELQEGDRVALNLIPRNIWWLRDDFRKNFFLWWEDHGTPKSRIWKSVLKGYPDCSAGLEHSSDAALLSLLESRFILHQERSIDGISIYRIGAMRDRLEQESLPVSEWRRLPPGCFSVSFDSISALNGQTLTLVAREESGEREWILDQKIVSSGDPISLSGCLLFPSCVKVDYPISTGTDISLGSVYWRYLRSPDLEPYFRNTLWGKMKSAWAKLKFTFFN